MSRIDTEGNFLPCNGYTIIAPVAIPNIEVYNYIKKSKYLSQYYSALPSHTYHMTLTGLNTVDRSWIDFFNNNEIIPQHRITDMTYHKYIMLIVDVPKDSVLYKLRSGFITLDKKKNTPYKFHITLAYQYKDIPNDKQLHENLMTELRELHTIITKSNWSLLPFKIYRYTSMIEFIPLKPEDALYNPVLEIRNHKELFM